MIKNLGIGTLAFLVLFFGFIYYKNKDSIKSERINEYKKITPQNAKMKLEQDKEIILLDVRTKEEYDTGHIEGSILIPLDQLEQEIENKVKDKNKEIIVYCRSGRRSKEAVDLLLKIGYENIYDLGGILDWPYEIGK